MLCNGEIMHESWSENMATLIEIWPLTLGLITPGMDQGAEGGAINL